jgi:hypothetical protein
MAGEILNFSRLSSGQQGLASYLPVATLTWALSTEASGIEPYQSTLRAHFKTVEEEICPAVMGEFAQVPQIARAFNDCVTYRGPAQDLFLIIR